MAKSRRNKGSFKQRAVRAYINKQRKGKTDSWNRISAQRKLDQIAKASPKVPKLSSIPTSSKLVGRSKEPISKSEVFRRIRKSMANYPDDLRILINAKISIEGDDWLYRRFNDSSTSMINPVLSSDRGAVEGWGEYSIIKFFELDTTMEVDEDSKVLSMTGKEFNDLLNRIVP